jgi:hypothetical protein
MGGGGREGEPRTLPDALRQIAAANASAAFRADAASAIAADDDEGSAVETMAAYELARLWDGLPALLCRELPFGVTKLLVYAATQDALLALLPVARERAVFALAVSLVSGVIAGLVSAFVSHPADTVVTKLATGGFGKDWRGAFNAALAEADTDDNAGAAKALFAGVAQRCTSTAIIVTAQFILFDGLRTALAVSKDDLQVALDIFKDRLDFYDGWNEITEGWVDAVDTLDDDLEFR